MLFNNYEMREKILKKWNGKKEDKHPPSVMLTDLIDDHIHAHRVENKKKIKLAKSHNS